MFGSFIVKCFFFNLSSLHDLLPPLCLTLEAQKGFLR